MVRQRDLPRLREGRGRRPQAVQLRGAALLLRDMPEHVQRRQAYLLRDHPLPAGHGPGSTSALERAQQPQGGGTAHAPLAEPRPAPARPGRSARRGGQRREDPRSAHHPSPERRTLDLRQEKQAHRRPEDPAEVGDAWIWRALALPSRLRVVSHLSHDRSDPEARAFLASFKARTDGRAPCFAGDQLPAYVAALIANSSTPEPSPIRGGPSRPRKEPRRPVDPDLRYAQIRKRREGGRVVEVKRQISFGPEGDLIRVLQAAGCGSRINTACVERDDLTSRQSDGRSVRKAPSHSQRRDYLRYHLDFEDAIYHFVRPHSSLRLRLRRPGAHGRLGAPRTPAMAAGVTDQVWSIEELPSGCPPPHG